MSGRWPSNTRICGYSSDWATLFKSDDQDLDLCDNFICTLFSNLTFPFHMSVTVDDPEWEILGDREDGTWDEETLAWFEAEIVDDFGFDGISVQVTRLAGKGRPRSCSAIWKIDSIDA